MHNAHANDTTHNPNGGGYQEYDDEEDGNLAGTAAKKVKPKSAHKKSPLPEDKCRCRRRLFYPCNDASWEEMLAMLRLGCRQALAVLFDHGTPTRLRFDQELANTNFTNRAMLDDPSSDAMEKLLRSAWDLTATTQVGFHAWVSTIVFSTSTDSARKTNRNAGVEFDDSLSHATSLATDLDRMEHDFEQDEVAYRELIADVFANMAGDDTYDELIVRMYESPAAYGKAGTLSFREIDEILGLPANTSANRWRAIKRRAEQWSYVL